MAALTRPMPLSRPDELTVHRTCTLPARPTIEIPTDRLSHLWQARRHPAEADNDPARYSPSSCPSVDQLALQRHHNPL